MKKYYNLEKTKSGYKLIDGNEVLIMNVSKYSNVPYYLKRLSPDVEYITGLFYDKKSNIYKGRDMQKNRIKLSLGVQYAIMYIN